MAATFRCSIVTPTETVFDDQVVYASVPAWDGQQGIMAGQSPILSRLAQGALRLDLPGGRSLRYLVEGGFAQVAGGELALLTRRATPAEKLSLEEAERELAEAVARAAEPGADRAKIEQDQQRAYARRALARGAAGHRA